MADRTVVVFAPLFELATVPVVTELLGRGVPVFRVDPAELVASLGLAAEFAGGWGGRLSVGGTVLELAEVGCAWWWPSSASADAARELGADPLGADAGLSGVVAGLSWLNAPHVVRVARYRPYQLSVAARVGLSVAPALLCNEAAAVRGFVGRHKVVSRVAVVAPVGNAARTGFGLVGGGWDDAPEPVAPVTRLFVKVLPRVATVWVVGVAGRLLAARVDEPAEGDWPAACDDWRYRRTVLPDPVAVMLRAYMMAAGLRLVVFELAVTPDDEYVFVQADPVGRWLGIEAVTSLPIAAAIADALIGVPAGWS